MKQISIFLLTLVICFQSVAQNDSGIVVAKQLKKGFYKTYQEYLDNNPSITTDFTTTLFRASKKDATVIAGTYDLTDKDVKIKKIWGFSDGENVFIRYKVLTGHKYWKLQVPGPHPYFLFKEKMILAMGPPIMAIATAATTAALPAGFEVMMITKSGKVNRAGKKKMMRVLADQPELLASFKKIKVMGNASRIKYLTLYSQAVTTK